MLCAPLTVLLLIIVEATVVALFAVDGAPVEVCLNKLVSSSPRAAGSRFTLLADALASAPRSARQCFVFTAPPLHGQVQAAVPVQDSWLLLVEIGPEGWTPTQQPPEFSPSLRLLSQGFYFYLCEERKC
jgi:hypothetical protein